jgi:hypothetical protein
VVAVTARTAMTQYLEDVRAEKITKHKKLTTVILAAGEFDRRCAAIAQ